MTGVNQFFKDDKALTEEGKERMVRQEADGGQILIT